MNYIARRICALLFGMAAAPVQAQLGWTIDLYAAGGFSGTINNWPNGEITGIGAGLALGVDATRRISSRFGATVGVALEQRFESSDSPNLRINSGAGMQWVRAGLVFYPVEISWVRLLVAPALVRVDLADPRTEGDPLFILNSLREGAMWHRALTFGGLVHFPWRTHYELSAGVEDFLLIWNTAAMERRMRESPTEAEHLRRFGPPDPRWPHLPRVRIGVRRRL